MGIFALCRITPEISRGWRRVERNGHPDKRQCNTLEAGEAGHDERIDDGAVAVVEKEEEHFGSGFCSKLVTAPVGV